MWEAIAIRLEATATRMHRRIAIKFLLLVMKKYVSLAEIRFLWQ